ncbi:MAG: type II toxin-antitoxin system Phd/YefM family antitoxin [Candidatus Hydrogenedentes bacterium]|nr:type II toxin-antitoxin system Phd/YefM family antitoxin [Candidatus Hydrogenedentota bacterium]
MSSIDNNILSLTEFKRRSTELLKRMQKERQPLILTVNGKPEIVVQTAADYQRLLGEMEKRDAIEGIRRGLESMKAGRGRPANEVFADLERKYPFLRRP